jgi:hypothetical protein
MGNTAKPPTDNSNTSTAAQSQEPMLDDETVDEMFEVVLKNMALKEPVKKAMRTFDKRKKWQVITHAKEESPEMQEAKSTSQSEKPASPSKKSIQRTDDGNVEEEFEAVLKAMNLREPVKEAMRMFDKDKKRTIVLEYKSKHPAEPGETS